jgi:hypothetical protein
MALTATITKLNTNADIPIGDHFACYGRITFAAADTYATGGFAVDAQIKRVFGVTNIRCINFITEGSDAGLSTGACRAKYDPSTGKVLLYLSGCTTTPTPQASDVEVTAAASIDACSFDFVTYCQGTGVTSSAGDYV